jgi:hypothetical protein
MTSPILVTGGTGTLGRHVVPRLRDAGCDVRVLSRRNHPSGDAVEFLPGDLATGEGIEAAVAGVGTVLHCAGSSKGDVRLLRVQTRRGAHRGRLRPAVDDAASHPVPRPAPDRDGAVGKIAGDTSPGRLPVPTGRRRRGGGPARGAHARRAGWPGGRRGRAARVRGGRSGPWICELAASTGCWFRSGSREKPPVRSGRARICLPKEPSVTGPGRTSWPSS